MTLARSVLPVSAPLRQGMTAAAFDGGFGFSKLQTPTGVLRIPALIAPVTRPLHDMPDSSEGGYVHYLRGSRDDLCGKAWLAGFPAYQYAPREHHRVDEGPDGKIRYGLQMLLGSLAAQGIQQDLVLSLVASIQDAQVLGNPLAQSLHGLHSVQFGSREPITISIHVRRIYEESYGVIAAQPHLFGKRQLVVLDMGYGTTIASFFGERGKLVQRHVVGLGAGSLIQRIATHPQTRARWQQSADPLLIREGIENASFVYGSTGWDFSPLYDSELGGWMEMVLAPVLKQARPWLTSADAVLAIGGGARLPVVADVLQAKGFTPVPNSDVAHLNGLYLLAQAALQEAG
jgi:hypothetical protein